MSSSKEQLVFVYPISGQTGEEFNLNIAKRVVCDLNTTEAFPNVLDLKCSPVEPILISTAAPRGHSFRGAEQVSSPRC